MTLSVTVVISVIISLASQEVFLAINELVVVTCSVTPNLFHCYYSVFTYDSVCNSLLGLPQGKREMGEWTVEGKNCIEEADGIVQYLAFGMKGLGRYD
jgi:hypothetical protein